MQFYSNKPLESNVLKREVKAPQQKQDDNIYPTISPYAIFTALFIGALFGLVIGVWVGTDLGHSYADHLYEIYK